MIGRASLAADSTILQPTASARTVATRTRRLGTNPESSPRSEPLPRRLDSWKNARDGRLEGGFLRRPRCARPPTARPRIENDPFPCSLERIEGTMMATINDLIFDCLQLGLDGEKVDYEWKRDNEN